MKIYENVNLSENVTLAKTETKFRAKGKQSSMPLILLSGFPSSGKSKRAREIKEYLEAEKGKKVTIVSENEAIGEVRQGRRGEGQ